MRLLLFGSVMWRIRNLGVNVYNGGLVPLGPNRTVEHVVPKCLFDLRREANVYHNLVPCDLLTNRGRRNYRIGDPQMLADVFEDLRNGGVAPRQYRVVRDHEEEVSGLVDRGTFYPSPEADMGLIVRSVVQTLQSSPYLYRYLDKIVDHESTLAKYYDLPVSPLEDARDREGSRGGKIEGGPGAGQGRK